MAQIKKGMVRYSRREVMTAVLFLLPAFVLFLVFKYYPLVDSHPTHFGRY